MTSGIPKILISLLVATLAAPALASEGPTWRPQATERLIKLPSPLMKRSIDRNFESSELGRALMQTRRDVALKARTLRELQTAAERAEDQELRTELRHQYLAEKRDFIALMGEQQSFERRRTESRRRLYAQVLEKLEDRGEGVTPQVQELLDDQDVAVQRFESSIAKVDLALFGSGMVAQSRYAREFAGNLQAIEKLTAAIQSHPMNSAGHIDGEAVSKQDYIRHLLAVAESDIAILDQGEAVLGYMAKLVALDAMALAEGIETSDEIAASSGSESEPEGSLASIVDLFVN